MTLLLAGLAMFWASGGVFAQPVNRDVFAQLAALCLSELTDTPDAFRLVAPDAMPYVRATLISNWNAAGKRVFVEDTSSLELPVLQYRITQASVTYGRRERRTVARDVALGLHVTMTRPDGSIVDDRICTQAHADVIRGARLSDLEDPSYPETQGTPPRAGWLRRYLEPAVTVGAVAVGVFLFFSLRSS